MTGVHKNSQSIKIRNHCFFQPKGSKPQLTLAKSLQSISVACSPTKLQSSIKSICVPLDSQMYFDKQVSEVCRTSYYHNTITITITFEHFFTLYSHSPLMLKKPSPRQKLALSTAILSILVHLHEICSTSSLCRTSPVLSLRNIVTKTSHRFWSTCNGFRFAGE